MNWKHRSLAALSTVALAAGGALAVAGPASAAAGTGNCGAAHLCVYNSTNFLGEKITASSTNSCFRTYTVVGHDFLTMSYVNNLSVDAYIYTDLPGGGFEKARTLVSGGFSSDINATGGGYYLNVVICEGSANPANYPGL
ncbi:peptidase inhibitor family I36 protein [Streptacidiphilus cavernicola]|uniref:Peptidase inhibitor family I36 protein n=1 Tax=Streptacidiphilus cavernicola TaxID=3342716 RepID=A0ABV6W3Z3_9ACTN